MDFTIKKMTGTNTGGACGKIRIVPVSKIETFGDVIELRPPHISLTSGSSWFEIEPTYNTAHPVERFEQQDQGGVFPFAMPLNISKITREKKLALIALSKTPVVVEYTDRNGMRCIVGTPTEHAIIQYKQASHGRGHHDRNQFDLVVKCTRRKPIPITLPLQIGSAYGGGYVGYLLKPTDPGYMPGIDHGIIVHHEDLLGEGVLEPGGGINYGMPWGCSGESVPATSSALMYGTSNTATIVDNCATLGIAARKCADLVHAATNDWVLPTFNDLVAIHENKSLLPGFINSRYWSSSTSGVNTSARAFNFTASGSSAIPPRSELCRVRPVRYF